MYFSLVTFCVCYCSQSMIFSESFGLFLHSDTFPVTQSLEIHWLLISVNTKQESKYVDFYHVYVIPPRLTTPWSPRMWHNLILFTLFSFVNVLMSDRWILNFSSHSLQTTPVYLVEQDIAAWSVCRHTRTQDASNGQYELPLPWLVLLLSRFQASIIKRFSDLGHSAVNRIWFAIPYCDFRRNEHAT